VGNLPLGFLDLTPDAVGFGSILGRHHHNLGLDRCDRVSHPVALGIDMHQTGRRAEAGTTLLDVLMVQVRIARALLGVSWTRG
jgi:hypothetical protein